jgi:hypothetical protein
MLAVSEQRLHLRFEMSRASDSSTRTIRRNRIVKAIRRYMDLPRASQNNANSKYGNPRLFYGSEGNSPQFDEKAGIFRYRACA